MSDEALTYVYAITRSPGPEDVARVAGVDGATVRLIDAASLTAVVSSVPADDFNEAALRTRLEDMDTLESLARAHHAVIDATAVQCPVLPLRLATVYRGDDRVQDILTRGAERFTEALNRLDGRCEWGVKVYAEPASGESAAVPEQRAPRTESTANPGKDYLRRRKQERQSAENTRKATAEFAGRVDAELSTLAVDLRHYRPQNPTLSGAQGENVLNAAYLVDADRTDEFAEAVRALNGEVPGTRVELTGPWAPYSFALPDPEVEPA